MVIAEEVDEDDPDVEEVDREGEGGGDMSLTELLSQGGCTIKRVDKDKNVIGEVDHKTFTKEAESQAATQQRMGTIAEYLKDMAPEQKLEWALQLKDQANKEYFAKHFEEASKLYNDCLLAMDFGGSDEQKQIVKEKLQLPVCTNLASCMIELGNYPRCIDICNLALDVDPESVRALYRRGLSHYRLANHVSARKDLAHALKAIEAQKPEAAPEEQKSLEDLSRRITVYAAHIQKFAVKEKASCEKMFETPGTLYKDRPDVKEGEDDDWEVDDSDEALEAALQKHQGWQWPCCRRRAKPESEKLKQS